MDQPAPIHESGYFRQTPRGYKAFYPEPLPPAGLALQGELGLLLSEADRALGALNMVINILPNPELLVGMFIQKEALLSSQIEGTQSSLVDILGVDGDHPPTRDIGEVLNYVKAMRHGMHRLQSDGMPLCLRIVREIHAILMQDVRGGSPHLTPGEFRTMQNWVGGSNLNNARYVPPPAEELPAMLGDFEKYLNANNTLPPLVVCALIHYQFETLHPFNDGNGRVGRLLITLYLISKGILNQPMLYLSAYMKMHQQECYDRLQQVRTHGTYEKWLAFFLEGMVTVSAMVVDTTRRIQLLERDDINRMVEEGAGTQGIAFVRALLKQPVVAIRDIERLLQVSYNKASQLMMVAEKTGIVRQVSQGRRNRKFVYQQYIAILSEGTELNAMP
jgi:Fic family protein